MTFFLNHGENENEYPDSDPEDFEEDESHEDYEEEEDKNLSYSECPYCGSYNEITFYAVTDKDGEWTGKYGLKDYNRCKHLVGLIEQEEFRIIDKYFLRYFTKNYAYNYSTIERLAESKNWMIREEIDDEYLEGVYYISSKAYDKIKANYSNFFDNFLENF